MMNLSDRAKAITAEDLIRRYDLDGLKKYKKAISMVSEGLTRTNANLENYVEAVTKDIKELQNQVDGNISVWSFNGVPSPSSPPANEWINEEEKNNHLGDLYYDQETGYAYRWVNIDNAYQWEEIKDKEVVEALAIANAAKDMADSKRRIFVPREIDGVLVEEPTTPYDAGDIWLYRGELYRCIRSREEGEWNTADWVDDMIYTDDTTANKAITDLGNFKEQVQITYVPNKVFTETNNSINSTIQAVQVAVSKKNTIFREEPTTPYIVGDVYIQNEKIYVCKTARAEGDYSSEDWELDLDATQYATKTQIEQTDERIRLVASSVDGKLNKGEVISEINVSPEEINITSDRFSLDSTNAKITKEGIVDFVKGTIGNIEIGENYLRIPISVDYNWTQADVDALFDRYTNGDTFTEEEIAMYDLNGDGKISLADTAKMYNLVTANITKDKPGAIEIVADGVNSRIVVLDGNGTIKSSMDLDGLYSNGKSFADIIGMVGVLGTNQKIELGTNDAGNLYLRGTVNEDLKYQLNCSPDGRLVFQKCVNGTWSNISSGGYRVGDMLVNKTDNNPGQALGGTWATDEIYFDYGGFSNPHTLVKASSATTTAFRSGNFIFVRYQFVSSVDLTDTQVDLLQFNLSTLGCTQFYDVVNHCAFTDGGNCVAMISVSKTGLLSCLDIIPDSKITSGQTVYGSFVVAVHPSHITARGPRFYQRTA